MVTVIQTTAMYVVSPFPTPLHSWTGSQNHQDLFSSLRTTWDYVIIKQEGIGDMALAL